jgi:hypothetical protein
VIFAKREDAVLEIFSDLNEIKQKCEGIDIESGVWDFFDEAGNPLCAKFNKPNLIKKYLFGLIKTVQSSQDFYFEQVTDGTEPKLAECLTSNIKLEKNNFFSSIEEVKKQLSKTASK